MLCVDWLARKRGWLKGIYPDCRIPLHTCILSSWRHIDYQFHWQQLLGYVHTCVPISVHFFRLNLSLNGRIRNPIHSYGVKISSVCIILHPFRILPLFYAEEWTEHTLFFFFVHFERKNTVRLYFSIEVNGERIFTDVTSVNIRLNGSVHLISGSGDRNVAIWHIPRQCQTTPPFLQSAKQQSEEQTSCAYHNFWWTDVRMNGWLWMSYFVIRLWTDVRLV